MKCYRCKKTMEFEEAKKNHGYWWCECGYEISGSRIPCDADMLENGTFIATDWDEQIDGKEHTEEYLKINEEPKDA